MRTAADIKPVALTINRNFLAFRNNILDDLDLVFFTDIAKDFSGFITIPDFTYDR